MSIITGAQLAKHIYHPWRFKITRNIIHNRELQKAVGENEKAA
jgi:hypothetical protein